jgi:hypothetical protein
VASLSRAWTIVWFSMAGTVWLLSWTTRVAGSGY